MSPLGPDVTLPWLVRLRWLVLACQGAALVAALAAGLDVRWPVFVAAIAIGGASNLWLARAGRWSPARRMGAALIADVGLLTALLAASGGATNPFTTLYLVYLTLSAVVLTARWTTLLTALAIGGYGILFLLPPGAVDPHAAHRAMADGGFGSHLQGMWLAFVVAALLTGFFVRRITQAIARQREQIALLRETAARNARLAALTTLAAGAAHELGSPLATVAVAAHEAHLAARRLPGAAHLVDDLGLILQEVDRCRDILHRLAARAGDSGGPGERIAAAELVAKLRAHLGPERSDRVDVVVAGDGFDVRAPVEQLVQSVVALIRNALDASAPPARARVELAADAHDVQVTIEDRGEGMSEDVLARVGEPFFTTKEPGRGLGLGVFLARAFFESCGGALQLRSSPGRGTRVEASLPREVALEPS